MLVFVTSQPPLSNSLMGVTISKKEKKKKSQVSIDIADEENRREKHPEEASGLRKKVLFIITKGGLQSSEVFMVLPVGQSKTQHLCTN